MSEAQDRIERQIDFIVNNQAQFSVDIQKLQEAQAELQASQRQAAERMTKIEDVVLRLANVTERRVSEMAEKVEALAEHGRQTDERLNILIGVAERFFSKGT